MSSLQEPDAVLARSLARLWPHREHESNCFKGFSCSLGLHRWARLDGIAIEPSDVQYCRWCSCVKLDGRIYDDGASC
jgi:hypothetical protein